MYCERCLGSIVEIMDNSIVWDYKDCDQEMGMTFSKMLTRECEPIRKEHNLSIINGRGYVEIKPNKLNKGIFTSFILSEAKKKGIIYDLIFAIGGDVDGTEFEFLRKLKNSDYKPTLNLRTCVIGRTQQNVEFYLETHNELKDLIESLASQFKGNKVIIK